LPPSRLANVSLFTIQEEDVEDVVVDDVSEDVVL
jgi:hypothetical protein